MTRESYDILFQTKSVDEQYVSKEADDRPQDKGQEKVDVNRVARTVKLSLTGRTYLKVFIEKEWHQVIFDILILLKILVTNT